MLLFLATMFLDQVLFQLFRVALLLMVVSPLSLAETEHSPRWKVVNYWSITCAPCRIEIPELNQLREELAQQNIDLVGINFDEDDRATTIKLAKRMGIEFPTLTFSEVDDLALRAPNVLPTTYIVSPDNEIKATLIGVQTQESIKNQLEELLND